MTAWELRIRKALKVGHFQPNARNLSNGWNTCAVGEAHRRAPRVVLGAAAFSDDPQDKILHELGMKFHYAVKEDRVVDAAKHYAQIQARVAELKFGV